MRIMGIGGTGTEFTAGLKRNPVIKKNTDSLGSMYFIRVRFQYNTFINSDTETVQVID